MSAEGCNCVTKWFIIVLALLRAVVNGINLFIVSTDDKDFDSQKIIQMVFLVIGIILAVLAFWGAFTENACLCHIALVWCIIQMIGLILLLIACAIATDDSKKCETTEFIILSIALVIEIVMVVCVWLFIRSISK